ncbi:response regulator [Aquabacterium sp. OR-4]|uniref:response regulator n=1 Tax=Aquabacterium sp. OR-4 TaxID=2978127 RepID=UPI0021B386E1|nr:response regulator [Aquabacterium sp. OR-4]MDT7833658.1 response regulator [Aquabacterium sp. OR-4]
MSLPADPRPSAAQRSILTVDDCAATRAVMCATLEAMGYCVQTADSGLAALEAVGRHRFDAFVLDVEMPGLDGMALGRALRQNPRTARAKIAMHTGLDEAQVRAGFSGYDAFVPKAGNPRLLGERVQRLLLQAEPHAA